MRRITIAAVGVALALSACGVAQEGASETAGEQIPEESIIPIPEETSDPFESEPGQITTSAAVPLDYLTFDLAPRDQRVAQDLLGMRATYKVDQNLLRYEQVAEDPDWGPLASLCWDPSDSDTQRYGFVRAEVGFTVAEHGTFDTSGGLELPMGAAPGVERGTLNASKAMTYATDYTQPECEDASWQPYSSSNAGGRILDFGYLMKEGRTEWGPVRVLLGIPYAFSPQAPNGDLRQIEQYSFLVVGGINDESLEALLRNTDGEFRTASQAAVTGPMTEVEGKQYPDAFQKLKAGLS